MSLIEIFQAGGIVMGPLALFLVVAIALSTERLIFWIRINRNQRHIVKTILATYRRAPLDAFNLLRQNLHLPISRIFLEALDLEKASPRQFRLALESATQAELPILKRFNTIFQTIITVSPLLGLLGTILGLIRSFDAIEIGGIGSNAEVVTGGISEALVSTAAGMVVAIFTLLFANLFRGLYKRQIALLQEHSGQLELLYEGHYGHINQRETAEYANS